MIVHHVQSCYPRHLVLRHNSLSLHQEIGTENNDTEGTTIIAMALLVLTQLRAVITTITTTTIATPHQRHGGVRAKRHFLNHHIRKKDLIRMVISAEHETSKLHSTLTNTLTLLDTES